MASPGTTGTLNVDELARRSPRHLRRDRPAGDRDPRRPSLRGIRPARLRGSPRRLRRRRRGAGPGARRPAAGRGVRASLRPVGPDRARGAGPREVADRPAYEPGDRRLQRRGHGADPRTARLRAGAAGRPAGDRLRGPDGLHPRLRERGDEAAAGIALRLGELARTAAASHGGRVVKLLGDGVLLRLPNAARAVDATLDLLESLRAVGLPSGHAGVHAGPLIEREGDVFGRSVNLAARVSDAAPHGEVYVTQAVAASLGDSRHAVEPVASLQLRGIGAVELYRVVAKGD